MKKVKALVAFSNGVIAMEQYEVRELPTDMANDLIAAGICVEISGGGSGGGVLEVTVDWDTANGTLDKTWQEIADAPMAIFKENGYTYFCVFAKQMGAQYGVIFASVNTSSMAWDSRYLFVASSADGYPAYTE